jgi:hypothetical protein
MLSGEDMFEGSKWQSSRVQQQSLMTKFESLTAKSNSLVVPLANIGKLL